MLRDHRCIILPKVSILRRIPPSIVPYDTPWTFYTIYDIWHKIDLAIWHLFIAIRRYRGGTVRGSITYLKKYEERKATNREPRT